ncbi:hypothetical protein [Haloferula sp.]|uniref:hypothetical protein n=1 Tax=Haloferula sp. TaxID=2497595 RepID=UPI003C77DCF9
MDADQPQNFNDRLSQWIASQGFWFQLRYSMSGGGGWSVAAFHLMRIVSKILTLLLIVAIGFAFYLAKRVNSEDFRESLGERFSEAMSAREAEIVAFDRVQGEGKIRRIGAEGSSTSFFQVLEAGNLNFKMGFFDGIREEWDAGVIVGNWLDIQVKAGANSPEEAAAAAETLFEQRPGFKVLGLNFTKARVTWGFEGRLGGIEGSKFAANRVSEGWRFTFKGGTFSQNWIREFEIEEIVMLCKPTELIVEKGVLVSGDGRIVFEGVKVVGGELPRISGTLVVKNVPVERLLPDEMATRISGSVSGELELSGSTNTSAGIAMEGPIRVGGRDFIQIRDEFPILEALGVVDDFNGYTRIVFNEGGFHLKTGEGEMKVTDISLEDRDQMGLSGQLSARYPTSDEAARTIGENALLEPLVRETDEEKRETKDLTLKRAALEKKKNDEEMESDEPDTKTQFFAGLATKRDEELLRKAAAQRALGTLVFDGSLVMSIPGDAFEGAGILPERYPVDPSSGRIPVEIPLYGTMSELTLRQAEDLLRDGRANP